MLIFKMQFAEIRLLKLDSSMRFDSRNLGSDLRLVSSIYGIVLLVRGFP